MSDEIGPALARLQAKLQSHQEQVRKTKGAINALHQAFDKPPPYPEAEQDETMRSIRPGQFYGQPLATCVRTILEMRRAAQLDAATVNEIFDALKEGGYAFEAKDDENAKSGLRQSLRKNQIFHRIPSGQWGLLAWYPNARVQKDDHDEDDNTEAKKKSEAAADDPLIVVPEPPTEQSKAAKKKASPPVNERAASVT
jgi:hypothetical protein